MRRVRTLLAAALLAVILTPLAIRAQAPAPPGLSPENASLFREVFGMVLKEYVDPKRPADVAKGAVAGLVESAGPECAYLPPAQVAAYRALRAAGPALPLYVTKGQDFARVLAVFPGTDPAVRVGDALRFVDGRSTYDLTYPQVLEALRGAEGEPVRCSFLKAETWQTHAVTLQRQLPPAASVSPLPGGAAALLIPALEAAVPGDLAPRLAAVRGAVLVDLRGCASEDDEAALSWLGLLTGDGEGLFDQGQGPKRPHPVRGAGLLRGRTIRVLVDGTTARAGEILAAGLAKSGATLVGGPTFGWAPRFEDLPLNNGGLLRLLTGFYADAGGAPIQQRPLQPVIALEAGETEAPAAFRARALRAAAPASPAAPVPDPKHARPTPRG